MTWVLKITLILKPLIGSVEKVDISNPSNNAEKTRPVLVKFSDKKKRDSVRKTVIN